MLTRGLHEIQPCFLHLETVLEVQPCFMRLETVLEIQPCFMHLETVLEAATIRMGVCNSNVCGFSIKQHYSMR